VSDHLPTVVGEGGEVLSPDDAVHYLARRDEENLRALEFLQQAIYEAQDRLLDERNTFDVDGRREPNAGGYQSLARRFRIETKPVATTVEWEPNRVYLEHGEGDPVPEHCRARVTVRAIAPWGHAVERQRSCSTRGEHFHYKDGGWNDGKYMDAEHICIGIAETRAANAAVKAILGLTREEEGGDAGAAAEGKERRRRKRSEGRLQTLRARWRKKLREARITEAQERALARATPELPDEIEAWDEDADYYEYALEMLERYGTRIFERAAQKLEEEGAPDPVREAEQKAGTGPEAITCPDCEEATLEPGMKACPNCGWLRDGPQETSSPSGSPSDETEPPTSSEADPSTSPTDEPSPATSDETESDADSFQEDIERNPLPEGARVEGEATEGDPPRREQPEIVQRTSLISRIDTLTKQLGEDPLRPRFLLAEIRGQELSSDLTEDDLPELRTAGLNLLEEIVEQLESEAADVGNGGEHG
jgi:hypothetical protein